jgi:hypothetical protein
MTQTPEHTTKHDKHIGKHEVSAFTKSWGWPGFLTGFFSTLGFLLIGISIALADGSSLQTVQSLPLVMAATILVAGIISTAMRVKELGLEKNGKYTIEREEYRFATSVGMLMFVITAVVMYLMGLLLAITGHTAGFNSDLDRAGNAVLGLFGLLGFTACLTVLFRKPPKDPGVAISFTIVAIGLAVVSGLFAAAIGAHVGWIEAGHSNN